MHAAPRLTGRARRRQSPVLRMDELESEACEKIVLPMTQVDFDEMLASGVMPREWRDDRDVRTALVRLVANGHLSANHVFVMLLDRTNYTGNKYPGAVVYKCSMCDYVGDRYYHSSKHFHRVHVMHGRPMENKRKYHDGASQLYGPESMVFADTGSAASSDSQGDEHSTSAAGRAMGLSLSDEAMHTARDVDSTQFDARGGKREECRCGRSCCSGWKGNKRRGRCAEEEDEEWKSGSLCPPKKGKKPKRIFSSATMCRQALEKECLQQERRRVLLSLADSNPILAEDTRRASSTVSSIIRGRVEEGCVDCALKTRIGDEAAGINGGWTQSMALRFGVCPVHDAGCTDKVAFLGDMWDGVRQWKSIKQRIDERPAPPLPVADTLSTSFPAEQEFYSAFEFSSFFH